MGYNTQYELEIVEGNYDLVYDLVKGNEYASLAMYADGSTSESCKWYDHDEDLKSFSKIHPNTLFKLTGVGEERPDTWITYYQAGKMQHCKAKISFDEFDKNKLHE